MTSFVEVVRLQCPEGLRSRSIDPGPLKHAIRRAAEDLFQHTIDQIRVVSSIALVKYRRIRAAILLMAVAATCIGAVVALQLAGW